VVGAIAIASAIAGAAIDRSFLVRPPRRGPRPGGPSTPEQDARRRAEMLERITKDLALTPAQRLAVDSVFVRTDSSLRAIRGEMQPRIQQALERSRADIAARLDAGQRVKFEQQSKEREKARRGRQ
jgi:hypothetical protein